VPHPHVSHSTRNSTSHVPPTPLLEHRQPPRTSESHHTSAEHEVGSSSEARRAEKDEEKDEKDEEQDEEKEKEKRRNDKEPSKSGVRRVIVCLKRRSEEKGPRGGWVGFKA
jgi:hypothetical protein